MRQLSPDGQSRDPECRELGRASWSGIAGGKASLREAPGCSISALDAAGLFVSVRAEAGRRNRAGGNAGGAVFATIE
jgi:hypothetical protein